MLLSVIMPLLVVLELFVMTHQGPTHAAVHLANMVTLTHNAVSTYMYINMYTKLQKLYYTRLLPIQPLPFSFLTSQSYVLGLQAVELWLPLSDSSLEKKEGKHTKSGAANPYLSCVLSSEGDGQKNRWQSEYRC